MKTIYFSRIYVSKWTGDIRLHDGVQLAELLQSNIVQINPIEHSDQVYNMMVTWKRLMLQYFIQRCLFLWLNTDH